MASVLDCYREAGREDLGSLNALHARFACRLKRFFRSYRYKAEDAEDLTQEVFVKLAASAERARLLNAEAFVFTLARNLVRDRARRLYTRAGARTINFDEAAVNCELPTPEECVETEQQLARVEQTLAALKPKTREAFMLHRVHGESYAAIATYMKVSISMVEKHIMSAMTALRDAHD